MPQRPPETRVSLILRLQDPSDEVAWREFASIYSPVVFRVAVARGFQKSDAENIVQEVLLAVAKSITPWLERTDRGRFSAWLLRIARNAACDLITSKATRSLVKDGEEADRLLAEVPDRTSLSSLLDLEHHRAVFQWAADQVRSSIAEQTWQAFWKTEVEGMSAQDVAKSLETRIGNVYVARCRVMARIKELVAQYNGEPLR
jgi:RNA polymerase sigma-70 factor, ECF subfamily